MISNNMSPSFGAKFRYNDVQKLVAEAKSKKQLPELAAMLRQVGNMPAKEAFVHYIPGCSTPGSYTPNTYLIEIGKKSWYSYSGYLAPLKHLSVKSTEDARPVAKEMQKYAMSENRFTRQVAKSTGVSEADFEQSCVKSKRVHAGVL